MTRDEDDAARPQRGSHAPGRAAGVPVFESLDRARPVALDVVSRHRDRDAIDSTDGGKTADEARLRRRRHVIEETSGIFDDAYPPGYLEELRKDGPD